MPKVSVIMSVYNEEKYLARAIDSILSQTFFDFPADDVALVGGQESASGGEFIIFDDGSTDGSGKILDKYSAADERIKVIHQENKGLTKTLNSGIKMAKGEYIARMDADDISLKERFKEQVDYLDVHPDVVLVSCFAKIIDENGREVGEHRTAINHNAIKKLSFFSGQLCHPAVMFRKSVIKELGGYNEDFIYAQDCELWFKLMKIFKVANIPKFLFLWRKSGKAIGVLKRKEQMKFARRAKIKAIKNGLYPKYYFIFLLWPYIRLFIPFCIKEKVKKTFR